MAWVDKAVRALRDHDESRARSMQADLGWSEVGGCRAYMGFRLDGAFEEETDKWAALRGTAIDKQYGPVLAEALGARYQVEVTYRGIPGHADLLHTAEDWVTDMKAPELGNAKAWAADPLQALWEKRVQNHGYAAGAIAAGLLTEQCTVRLLIMPSGGKFADWYVFEEPFNRDIADAGADRLDDVRARLKAGIAPQKDEPYQWCKDWCLAGETEVVTRAGIRPIRELAGNFHSLLVPSGGSAGPHAGGGHGQWQECEVKSFGVQPLMQLTLRRLKGVKVVYATAGHRWVAKDGSGIRTADLIPGTKLRSIRRNVTAGLAEVPFAVAQGFVYGDGSLPAEPGTAASLRIYQSSPKPEAMLGYFAAHEVKPVTDPRDLRSGWHIPMLPRTWKSAPDLNETRSFLLSWLAGYLAADGTVKESGQTIISSSRRESIELVRSICAIVGVGYSSAQIYSRVGIRQSEPSDLFSVSLRTRDLPDWVFKLAHHRARAAKARAKDPHETSWVVQSVEETERVEEVFCAVVPGPEAFALADELLTHNCGFFAICRKPEEADEDAEITNPEVAAAVARYGELLEVTGPAEREKEALAPVFRGFNATARGWRVSTGKPGDDKRVLDEDAIRATFAEWDMELPEKAQPVLDEDAVRAIYAAWGTEVPEIVKPGRAAAVRVTRVKDKEAAK